MEQPGTHRESTVNGFHQFFVKKDKISGISSTKLTMAHGICYSLFGNGVCNGAISIMQHCFINDYYKVNAVGQWGKIMITIMGFALCRAGSIINLVLLLETRRIRKKL